MNEEDRESIADRIAKRREGLKLTQERLAALVGVPTLTISKWETGRQKPERFLEKLAESLQTTPAYILRGTADAGRSYLDIPERVPLRRMQLTDVKKRLSKLSYEVIHLAFRLEDLDDEALSKVDELVTTLRCEAAARLPETERLRPLSFEQAKRKGLM